MSTNGIHFDGPMMIGGMPYSLKDVADAERRTRIPTGVLSIDMMTGGIGPGEFWAVSGQSGSGVTALCNQIAVSASQSVEVVLCNGHVPSLAMVRDLQELGSSRGLRLASWLAPLDFIEANEYGWPTPALYVLDTWDELFEDGLHGLTYTLIVDRLRYVRRRAATSGIAVVCSARVPKHEREEPIGWLGEALAEVAHVRVEVGYLPSQRYTDIHVRRGASGRVASYLHRGEFRSYSREHESEGDRS